MAKAKLVREIEPADIPQVEELVAMTRDGGVIS